MVRGDPGRPAGAGDRGGAGDGGGHPRHPDEVLLFVNRGYFDEHPEFFAGVLLHEVHHLVYGHLHDAQLLEVERMDLMELAMEMAADEEVRERLPSTCSIEPFARLGIGPGQSTMERYRLLVAAADDGRLRIVGEDELRDMDPEARRAMFARSGSGEGPLVLVATGRESPSVLDRAAAAAHRPGRRMQNDSRGLGDLMQRRARRRDQERFPRAYGRGRPTGERALRRYQAEIKRFLRGDAGGAHADRRQLLRDRHGRELQRRPAATAPEVVLPWPALLRRLLPVQREQRTDYRRPNRRFPHRLGELPGRRRQRRRPSLLVGVDTSASLTDAHLARFRVELLALSRHADVQVVECDAEVQRVHRDPAPERFVGGGDTEYGPVLELGQRRPREYDGVVYFTDGKGPWPEAEPPMPVLWVLTNDDFFDCPYGAIVRLG